MTGLHLVRVAPSDFPWSEFASGLRANVFRTRQWFDFLHESQGAEAVLAEVRDGTAHIGWFSGAMIRYLGARVLGSPLPGWTTSYMGFGLDDPSRYPGALDALRAFAFGALRCVHLEVMDRSVPIDIPWPAGYTVQPFKGFQARLDLDDDELLARMSPMARRNIRTAERNGVTVELVTSEFDRLGRELHDQLVAAFARRGSRPAFREHRILCALRHIGPSDRAVVLRARREDGRPVASGVFPGVVGGAAVLWMVGGDGEARRLRANELLMWSAMRAWRDRGAEVMDFGGGGAYKEKYGGVPISVPWGRSSRFSRMESVRGAVGRLRRSRAVGVARSPR